MITLPTIKRVDRLIAVSVIGMVLIVWLVLVGFDTLTQFLRQLGDVGKGGYTMPDAIIYIAWTVPRRMYEWFGNAALIGGLLGLGGLATSGELTALRAAGMSKLRVIGSVVVVLAILTGLVMLMGETIAPYGARQAQALQLRVHSKHLGTATSSGLWARDGDNIINAKAVLAEQDAGQTRVRLADVRVFTFDPDGMLTRFVHAKGAIHRDSQWWLEQARTSRLDASGVHSSMQSREPWPTHLDVAVLKQSIVHPEYLSMRDLQRNIRYLENNHQNPIAYAKAFWAHALYPVNVLVLVLCALPFAFGALRSGGLGKRIFIGVVLALAWYFLQQGLTSVGIVYGSPAWLAELLPAIALVIVATIYFRRFG
ncbi:MAG TPA: LPS export ABC transporter permease LptG [Oleiagrimonas sp.]|nr:LPS export ABC transporter permease LptG [Oleiagrimonas sp.]